MKSIKDIELRLKPKYTLEEVMQEVYEDIDVQAFLKKYRDYIDEDMLHTARSRLLEYIREKDNPTHTVELVLYNDQIEVVYTERDTPLNQKYRDRVPSKLFYDNSTRKYKGVTMDDYETNMDNTGAVGKMLYFIDNYEYGSKLKGMWVHGSFGVGKTFLMGAAATELHKRKVGVNFISASQLVNDLYEIIRKNSKDTSVQKKLDYLSKSEVLIIDDLGTEKMTRNNFVDVFYHILKYRGEHNKPTFITSNFTKDQYYQHANNSGVLDRIEIARFKEQVDVLTEEVQMRGENRRVKA